MAENESIIEGEKGAWFSPMPINFPFKVAAFSFGTCAVIVLARGMYAYWDSPRLINFLAAWIPAVLSVLVAFVPDREMEMTKRITWRVLVIFCGVFYSLILWHQQVLTDKTNEDTNRRLLGSAVGDANKHSDYQFVAANRHADAKFGEVEGDVKGVSDQNVALSDALKKATGDINSNLGKVGKPDPPVPARLIFGLWDASASLSAPTLTKTIDPDGEGNYPVDLLVSNQSESTADAVDIWIEVCTDCSFAKEPPGFEKPSGIDEHVRHKVIGSLNPGVSFEKIAIFVKVRPTVQRGFAVALRYSCKTCGGKVTPNQSVAIFRGIAAQPNGVKPQ
jgi:hypothetical protein